jgi:hypothetical protein
MPSLRDHYLRTTYRVTEVDPAIDIRVGEPCPALDALLKKHESGEAGDHPSTFHVHPSPARSWAFITAWNPGSKKLDDAENRRRQEQLEAEVKQGGYVFYRGAGVPDEKGWQAEESMLILGIEPAEATRLGKKYGQVAIVMGTLNALPKLLFL